MNDDELERLRELIDMHRQYGHALSIQGEAALLAEVDRLRAIVAELGNIHAPVEVPSLGKCCKANHGVAWKRWPCKEAELMDLEGRSL